MDPASKCYFCAVGGNGDEVRGVVEVRKLPLILAVEIHHPDFLVAGAVGSEVDMRSEQRRAAGEGDDVGGEFVGDLAGAGFIDRAEIALGDKRGGG